MASGLQSKDGSVNLLDLFFYILSYWLYIVISIGVCVTIAVVKYEKSELSYSAAATIIIKNPSNTKTTTRLVESYSGMINRTTVSNELLQFRSRKLMTDVVGRLNANVSYKTRERLRYVELYKDSPVILKFSDNLKDCQLDLSVTPKTDTSLLVKVGSTSSLMAISDTLSVLGGYVTFSPNWNYGADKFGKEVRVSHISRDLAARQILSRLSISQLGDDGSLLSFVLEDSNNSRACDILSVLFEAYNDAAVRDKNELVEKTAGFINERIAVISRELGAVEDKIQSYKIENHVMSVDEAANQFLVDGRAANSAIVAIETKIRLAEYIKDYVCDSSKFHDMIPANMGLEDAGIESTITQYNNALFRRESLLLESSEESPVIKGIDNSLVSFRRTLLNTIDNHIETLNLKKKSAENMQEAAYEKFQRMPQTARQMVSIERQQQIKENLYTYLLNKREENALSSSMVDNNARLIDVPEGSVIPIAPSKKKMALLGFLIGLMIPLVILIGRLIVDMKVRTRKELEDSLTVPVAGELPLQKIARKNRRNKYSSFIYYDGSRKNILTESLRLLCTNLDILRPVGTEGGMVIALSSFTANSGKSFTSANLAACYADNMKKVVLLDLDLRKRSISHSFGIPHKTKGISNYLYDQNLEVSDVLVSGVVDGVDFIPAGMVPPNPVELLKRDRLDGLIAELKKSYDYIIIDGLPVEMLADSLIINRVSDMTVFVIRSGTIDRRMLPYLEELYQSGKFTNMNVVLNGSPVRSRYGYYYGYGYGYGYGYTYGYEDDDE